MGVLDRILASKRSELPGLRRRRLPQPPALVPLPPRRTDGAALRLICEIKKRSPSAGPLSCALTVRERARAYEEGGASMLSVLCDTPFFDGSFDDLRAAREACSLPLLCKEFILDECQLDAARAYGASAVLLIVRCLPGDDLQRLIEATRARELVPLVEVVTEEEAARALDAGADHIGVNARDLDTLEMDAGRAQRVLAELPPGAFRAHFSGVKTTADVTRVLRSGADAALIGETLMRQDDPLPILRQLAAAAADPG